jgi:hypothetical protein
LSALLGGLKAVFGRPLFFLLATIVAIAVLVVATWLPNLGLVWQVALSGSASLADKATILFALTGSLVTNFAVFSALGTIAISGLFGANVAAIVYLVRQRRRASVLTGSTHATTSVAGLVSGAVGVGCAACGTLVLGPLLSFMGGATLTSLLPFAGGEFTVLGIVLLSASLIVTVRRIAQPVSCAIESASRLHSGAALGASTTGIGQSTAGNDRS